jgi:hypothetical protein
LNDAEKRMNRQDAKNAKEMRRSICRCKSDRPISAIRRIADKYHRQTVPVLVFSWRSWRLGGSHFPLESNERDFDLHVLMC